MIRSPSALGPSGAKLLADAGRGQIEIEPADVSWPDDATFQALLRPASRPCSCAARA